MILATLAAGTVPVRVAQDAHARTAKTIHVDHDYGTLSFHGTIQRIDAGDEYEIRPHLTVTFRPNGPFNRVAVADLQIYEIVATKRRDNGPAERLYRDIREIRVLLEADGQTATLPPVLFRLSKSISEVATHVGLGVSDGHKLWPISAELK